MFQHLAERRRSCVGARRGTCWSHEEAETGAVPCAFWSTQGLTADGSSEEWSRCGYDRQQMLLLTLEQFDQDPERGWRKVASLPGCERAAADLIRDYRVRKGSQSSTLYWHEGQLRASAGETSAAAALMAKAYHAKGPLDTGWNHYVDATIAFLRNDRHGLVQARQKLATTPWPSGLQYVDEDGIRKPGPWSGWPANLDVVDGLIACFGKPYAEAYSARCRTQAGGS